MQVGENLQNDGVLHSERKRFHLREVVPCLPEQLDKSHKKKMTNLGRLGDPLEGIWGYSHGSGDLWQKGVHLEEEKHVRFENVVWKDLGKDGVLHTRKNRFL